jgi:hypothetical protein
MARKAAKPKPVMPVHYVFEIAGFEPTYMLSVNPRRDDDKPWWEHLSLEFATVCRLPERLAERPATFQLVADREFWTPYAWRRDHDWRPLGVGLLEISPMAGRFYASIPNDSMPTFMTAMAHGLYRYVLLYGPPLKRGKSLCTSLDFRRAIDFDDY